MRIVRVIEARHWRHAETGATASIYGAGPVGSGWAVETCGWTWEKDNGTTGLCRMPAKTREEAETVMREFNERAAPKSAA